MKKILIFILAIMVIAGCEKDDLTPLNNTERNTLMIDDSQATNRGKVKVNVCHQTGSETNPFVHIEVSENALDAHLAHGDGLAGELDENGDLIFGDCVPDMPGYRFDEQCQMVEVTEICDNGIDDDCDGEVDEGCIVEVILLEEDFEEYTEGTFPGSGGWVLRYRGLGSQYQVVSTQESVSGTQSLKLEGRAGNAALVYHNFNLPGTVEEIFLESNIHTQIECWCIPDYWYGYAAFALGNSNYTWDHARLLFRQDNQFWLWRGGPISYLNHDFVASQWYNVRIKYNKISKLAWVWVDDILIASGVNLTPAQILQNNLTVVMSSDNGGHTTTYFDDVKVWYEM